MFEKKIEINLNGLEKKLSEMKFPSNFSSISKER